MIVGGAEFSEHVCELVGVPEIRGESEARGRGRKRCIPCLR